MDVRFSKEVQDILSKPTATVEEAGRVLGIGRRQAYEGVRQKEIPSLRIGKRIVIPTRRLIAMIDGEPQRPRRRQKSADSRQRKGSQHHLAPRNPNPTRLEVKIMTTIAPATINISDYNAAVQQSAPAGFAFNFRAYLECGEISWVGPIASTADERLNVIFEWDPSLGASAELDLLPEPVTPSSRCENCMRPSAQPSKPSSQAPATWQRPDERRLDALAGRPGGRNSHAQRRDSRRSQLHARLPPNDHQR